LSLPESAQDWNDVLGVFGADKTTPFPIEELPINKALRGESSSGVELFVRNQNFPDGIWYETYAAPLKLGGDGSVSGAIASFIDCRQRKFLEEEALSQNTALLASEAEKLEIITRLRTAVEQLSTPILELWEDVLALPVIGIVDSRRSSEMMERLLQEIVAKQSRFVIIDLTGVEVIDTSTADHFMKLVKAVGLIGARCVLTGIRPAVAQTLVDLDVSFGQLETLRNLRHGLRYCLRWLDNEGV
jgi:rsbT co-antagonist protein RsbR